MLARLGRDLGAGLQEMHRRFGPVVDVGHGPARAIYLFGADANEHVLSSAAAAFEWGPAMRSLVVVDGPTALVVSDGEDHRRRRRLVQPAFSRRRVDAHLGLIVREVDRVLDTWRPGSRLDAHASLRSGVRRIVLRALFGEHLGDRADEVGERLEPALRYIQRNPLTRLDVSAGVNAYSRSRRGVRATDEIVRAEIARRRGQQEGGAGSSDRADEGDPPDVLSALLVEADADGDVLDEDELLDQVRSLVAAGYDTTSGGAAWLVLELGRNPAVLAEMRDEIADVLGDRPPTVGDLPRLSLAFGAVHETLRLWPPGFGVPRWSIASSTLHGHEIPADRLVLYSPYVTGRLPELWPEPERFDPKRWAPGAPDPHPYSFVPFGGGYRRCIGFALATLELQVIAVRLAQRVEWRLRRSDARPTGLASATPKGGVPIEVLALR